MYIEWAWRQIGKPLLLKVMFIPAYIQWAIDLLLSTTCNYYSYAQLLKGVLCHSIVSSNYVWLIKASFELCID